MAIQNSIGLKETGIVTADGAGAFTGRTITGTTDQISVADGDGGSGNPTISTPQDIASTSSPTFAGLTLTADLTVPNGGTGRSTGGEAYSVICAGTTAAGVQQNVAALGSRGDVLTSQGAGALPQFAAPVAATDVSDATFRIQDDGDATKEIAFEASGITTGTVRTITMDDAAVNLSPNDGTYAAAAGGTNIVTVGTITTGVWTGTDVGVADGGTGASDAPTALSNLGGIGAATSDTLTNKTFDANGTGNSLSNVDVADLANGTDGELITWDAAGAPATVAVGTATHVLTSNGAGAAPTFQAAAGGTPEAQVGLVQNLSLSVSGGTLTIASGDGSALSASNIGYVCAPSSATPGELVLHSFTANVTMTNTDMNGNILNTTASTAWGNSKPMYLYVMQDDSDANPVFAWGAVPNITYAPPAADIGDPSAANADIQTSLYSWTDITEANYNGNAVVCIGSCGATKDASDVWTFTVTEGQDGIGLFNEETRFTFPTGQYAANSGTYTDANGGTAAVYNSSVVYYQQMKNGFHTLSYSLRGDGGTDGSGSVEARFVFPMIPAGEINGIGGDGLFLLYRVAGGNFTAGQAILRSGSDHEFWLYETGNTGTVQWGDMTNGDRFCWGTLNYLVKSHA